MKVADLFVNIGITGSDAVSKALTGTKNALGEVSSMSLEAKAAILGVIYGLEQMMSTSMRAGTSMLNFQDSTGMSAQTLQQWGYAATKAGGSVEEMEQNLRSVQKVLMAGVMGKGLPAHFADANLALSKAGLPQISVNDLRDIETVMKKLQQVAQLMPNDFAQEVIGSFGGNSNLAAQFQRNVFRPDILKSAPVDSKKELETLNKIDGAWGVLSLKMKKSMRDLVSEKGLPIIDDISKLADQFLRLTKQVLIFVDQIKVFKAIGLIFEGWLWNLEQIGDLIEYIKEPSKAEPESEEKTKGKSSRDIYNKTMNAIEEKYYDKNKSIAPITKGQSAKTSSSNIEINQNLNFNSEGRDHKEVASAHSKAIRQATRQMPSQLQVN